LEKLEISIYCSRYSEQPEHFDAYPVEPEFIAQILSQSRFHNLEDVRIQLLGNASLTAMLSDDFSRKMLPLSVSKPHVLHIEDEGSSAVST